LKSIATLSAIVGVASIVSGCSKPKHATVVEHEPNQQKQFMHDSHQHQHAFADPVQMAKNWNDPDRDNWQHPEEIVAAMGLKSGATVADIGAGTGYMVAHISQAIGKEGNVIAIDASTPMIEYLTTHSNELGPARITPQKVDFDDPELKMASVDSILTLDTWHHVNKREAYAKKVYEGLKLGGRFVVVDHEIEADIGPPKEMRLNPAQVAKQLESAGFRVEVVPESMPRHYMVVGHKD
jgi:predicted methyltransferase